MVATDPRPLGLKRRMLNQPLETYQDEIYLAGMAGDKPILPADLCALEDLARQQMPPESFDYICGGAGSEDSVSENAAAFRRWRIVPRMLTDVSTASFASTVLGAELAAPIMLGPVGVLKLAHPEGEVAVARAAAAAGAPIPNWPSSPTFPPVLGRSRIPCGAPRRSGGVSPSVRSTWL